MTTSRVSRGRFITFEGMDGCGKTTQLRILGAALREGGEDVLETVEPGGTDIGRQVRRIVLDPANTGLRPRPELLLYFASRAQNVAEVIRPALEKGTTVLCDRFTDSTVAYQGYGRGLDKSIVYQLDEIACEGLKPDMTFLLDIDGDTSLHRARKRNQRVGQDESRIDDESAAFHERVRQGYLALAAAQPERFIVIDGRASIAKVAAAILEAMTARV